MSFKLHINMPSIIIGLILTAGIFLEFSDAKEYAIEGRIESLRKNGMITLLFKTRPAETVYSIIKDKIVLGTVEIIAVEYAGTGKYLYRCVATYTLASKMYSQLIRAGADIGLRKFDKHKQEEFSDSPQVTEKDYRQVITTGDGRLMVLVPEGKFVFGSNQGDRDESPEQVVYLDNYYIDKYEVSNKEYKTYVEAANVRPPLSWEGGIYNERLADLPVLVTFHEAAAYAGWSGKRLPTEEEWEKAARGIGKIASDSPEKTYQYPWGNTYNPEKLNCADFWASDKIGAHIKLRFNIGGKGLMPVLAFDPEGASPYGIVNMAGNAKEWTSSWYMPYKGNKSKQGKAYKRYGNQYKVVRGGAWYSPKYRTRVTSREIGGIPNLYTDNLAGFRCVKEASQLDLKEN
jgi:formylglycine-generating enzyme required for sulfatase activity